MSHDEELHARVDAAWMRVILRARHIRQTDLRTLAEAWAGDRDAVALVLDQLAAALDRPAAGWDAALADAESDLGMDEPEVRLDETQAHQLADGLRAAATSTLSAWLRADTVIPFPSPLDRGHTA